jgi:transposase
MKLQDVLLKAMAKKISWMSAAEIAGITDRTMRRIRERYQKFGYTGLFDQRRGKRSTHRIPMETAEEVLRLYKETYFDLNIRLFHEKLREEHKIVLSYTWVQQALQGAGLVAQRRKRGPHRRRRPRRALPGMLLHIDGSKHQWLSDDRWHDLIVILDDASSEIYYAQLVEEESTRTVMAGLREVIENKGLFCALYSDRGSHFFVTTKAGEKVDKHRPTQVGRALKELGVQMIAAYSAQARWRSERSFGTWQGRLPKELRLAGITTVDGANAFLRASCGGAVTPKSYDGRARLRRGACPLSPPPWGHSNERGSHDHQDAHQTRSPAIHRKRNLVQARHQPARHIHRRREIRRGSWRCLQASRRDRSHATSQ